MTTTETYTSPGTYTLTLPSSSDAATVTVEGAGGGGGGDLSSAVGGSGGAGGRLVCEYSVSGGETITINVGGGGGGGTENSGGSGGTIGPGGDGYSSDADSAGGGGGGGYSSVEVPGFQDQIAGGGGGAQAAFFNTLNDTYEDGEDGEDGYTTFQSGTGSRTGEDADDSQSAGGGGAGLEGGAAKSTGGVGGGGQEAATVVTSTRGGGASGGGGELDGGSGSVTVEYTVPPAAPQNVTLDTATEGGITVSWDDVSNEDSYQVYRSSVSGTIRSDYTLIAEPSANTTTYVDGGLNDGEEYFYRIGAVNGDGESELSPEAAGVTILPAPTDLTAEDVRAAEVDLSWTANHNNGDTRVEVSEGDDGTYAVNTTVAFDTETATATGLLNGQLYGVRVVADTGDAETEDV